MGEAGCDEPPAGHRPPQRGCQSLEVDDAEVFDELVSLFDDVEELSDFEVEESDVDDPEPELSLEPDEPEDDEPDRLSFL